MQIIRYFIFSLAAAGICLAAPVFATTADDASKYVQTVGDQALAVIADKNASKDQKEAKLEKIFSTNVDFPWVARFAMGQYWRQATPDQKTRYVKAYQNFEIHHYTSRFSDYNGGVFKITGSRPDSDNEFTVSTQMKGDDANSEPVIVEYHVRKGDAGFRIYDFNVEGVSMITTQRSEFSSLLQNNGIDYLISQLESKAQHDGDSQASAQ